LRGFSAVTDEADDENCCSSGLGATDLLRFSPPPDIEADRVAEAEEDEDDEEEAFFRWKGVNLRDLAEEGSGGGGSAERRKDGGDEGEAEGGGWPPSGKKGLDLEEETSIPSFSCRQKAHIPPPATAAAAAPGLYGCSLQYWMPSSGSSPAPAAWPSS
jgi:hypothetical protein